MGLVDLAQAMSYPDPLKVRLFSSNGSQSAQWAMFDTSELLEPTPQPGLKFMSEITRQEESPILKLAFREAAAFKIPDRVEDNDFELVSLTLKSGNNEAENHC